MQDSVKIWLEKAPYSGALGVQVDSLSDTSARFTLPYKDENSNPGKVLHGGVAASMICLGGQAVARLALGEEAAPWHTCALQVNYLAAAIDQAIVGEARLLRKGKELCHTEVRITSDQGKPIAEGIATVRGRFGKRETPGAVARGDDGGSDPGQMGPHLNMIPFIKRLGLTVEQMAGGQSRVCMPFQETNADDGRDVHEGPILALLDTAGAMAAWAVTGYGPYKASTVGIQAQMLGSRITGDLTAYGRVVHRDNEIFWSDVEIATVTDGRIAARGTVLYRIIVP